MSESIRARISFRDRERCRILLDGEEREAAIAGALLYRAASPADLPAVGDWVEVRLAGGGATVEAVLPRRSAFSRRAAGRREVEQVVAANIDVAFLVMGLDADFNLRRLERTLALAWESGADPVVALNKSDVCADVAGRVAAARASAAGAPVLALCAARGEVDALRAMLGPESTAVLLGSSGAGKSTIANALLGEERQAARAVRESDGRGRHTTTARQLFPLPSGGALIDTPGLRELQLWDCEEGVARVFSDVEEAARRCRFRDCAHSGEPGCAVADAIASGALDRARWESFEKLRREASHNAEAASLSLRLERKRKWKLIHKAQRARSRLVE